MIHINRYIDRLKVVESKNSRELVLTIQEARDLHADITKLLLAINELANSKSNTTAPTKIEVSGENWG